MEEVENSFEAFEVFPLVDSWANSELGGCEANFGGFQSNSLLWFYCLRIILEGGLLKGKKVRKEGVSV
jgi:hypothetical protein